MYYGPLSNHTKLSRTLYERLLTDLKKAGIIEFLYRWDCPRGEQTAIVSEQEYVHAMESEKAYKQEEFQGRVLNDTCDLCDWEDLCEDGENIRRATNRKEFQKIFRSSERIGRMIR